MLKKTIRRLGALAMVLAMAVSVFAVNAFADGESVTYKKTLPVKKTVTKEANVLVPTEAFEFIVEPGETKEATADSPAITAGKATDVEISTTTVTGDVSGTTATGEATLKIKNVYDAPGIYSYKISEKSGTLDGMKYDSKKYVLNVYVDNKGEVTTALYDENNQLLKNGDIAFTNDYGHEDNDNGGTYNLKVAKVITGNMAIGDETFEFKIGVNKATTAPENTAFASKYNVIVYDKNGQKKNSTDMNVALGNTITVTLGNGEYAMVYGLSPNNVYSIEETKHDSDGFVTTVEGADSVNNQKVATGSCVEADDNVTYTNKKEATTPGGVIMTIAPYALMVVLAGAFAVVFLTRRNRAE